MEESELPVPFALDATDGAEPARATASGPGEDSLLIQLNDFEGPLDLLLYLIQRDELDIYNIPISKITAQYLEYIELIDVFDLDNAGEFIVMAATLMRIKARLLLPVTRPGEEDEDDIDPRDELVRRLLEYKKYKEAAQDIADKEQERSHFFGRGGAYPFLGEAEEEPVELSLTLFDLLGAVRNVLQDMRGSDTHRVYTEVYTVEGQEERILRALAENSHVRFEELFQGMAVKMEVVVTFIAILDLLKRGHVRANQSKMYGEIWLEALEVDQESPESNTTTDGQDPAEDQDD